MLRTSSPHTTLSDHLDDEQAEIIDQPIENTGNRTTSNEGEHPVADALVFVHPTVPETPQQKSWPQAIMVNGRVLLACLTSNYSLPVLEQPYDELYIYALCMLYLEATAGIYYAAAYDRRDTRDRLRVEWRGNALLGFTAISLKITAACTLPGVVGLTKGFLQLRFASEIAANPDLVRFTAPLLSRNLAAVISLPLYIGGRKLVSLAFPSPIFRYNTKPSLHFIQKGLMYILRMVDAISIFKFIAAQFRAYGAGHLLHNPHSIVGAVIIDQLLVNIIDRIGIGAPALDPFARTHELAPISGDLEAGLPATQPLISDGENSQDENIAERYAQGRGQVYRGSHNKIKCGDAGKIAFYSARIIVVLGFVALFNLVLNQVVDDKENLPEPQYTGYLSGLLAMAILVEAGFQHGLPWAYHKIANASRNCHWRRFFSRNNPVADPAPQVIDVTEESHLLASKPTSFEPGIN